MIFSKVTKGVKRNRLMEQSIIHENASVSTNKSRRKFLNFTTKTGSLTSFHPPSKRKIKQKKNHFHFHYRTLFFRFILIKTFITFYGFVLIQEAHAKKPKNHSMLNKH